MTAKTKIEQLVVDKVRELRVKAGLSQESLSFKMDLSSKFVGNVESVKQPAKYNLNHLQKIAEILGCSIREFFPE